MIDETNIDNLAIGRLTRGGLLTINDKASAADKSGHSTSDGCTTWDLSGTEALEWVQRCPSSAVRNGTNGPENSANSKVQLRTRACSKREDSKNL